MAPKKKPAKKKTGKKIVKRKQVIDESILDLNHETLSKLQKTRVVVDPKTKKKYTEFTSFKGTRQELEQQRERIKKGEKRNSKIYYESRKLKMEQVRKGTSKERVREIDIILKSKDFQLTDLKFERNYLRMLEGRDFDFLIDDRFSKYYVRASKLAKQENVAQYILTQLEKKIKNDIDDRTKKIKDKRTSKKQKEIAKKQKQVLQKLLGKVKLNQTFVDSEFVGDLDAEPGESGGPMIVSMAGPIINITA